MLIFLNFKTNKFLIEGIMTKSYEILQRIVMGTFWLRGGKNFGLFERTVTGMSERKIYELYFCGERVRYR